jgi:integrase
MFNLAIDSKLRGCDLMNLRVRDISHGNQILARAMVVQRKTQRPVQFELTEPTRGAVAAWITSAGLKSEHFLFPSRPARLARLCHFARYLKQFEPDTEIPAELVFGLELGRVAPHIYHEEEIVELLAATAQLGPRGSLRPATYATLFGLMASSGLRVSEAIHLRDADVDLKRGMPYRRIVSRWTISQSVWREL